jgi:hypothetical protein
MDQEAVFGWKTSVDHWNDDAVWGEGVDPPPQWNELIYPPGHPWMGESIDLAFGLVSEEITHITKWSQPPQPYVPENAFNGWDEYSVYGGRHIVADDWVCDSDVPVSDVHWWGSFLGWYESDLPWWQLPAGFQIGIWTDVPAGVDQDFSHPGRMIWESYAAMDELDATFVGWDFDPRDPMAPPEATFRFDHFMPEEEWFWQEGNENIFWVSIAADYGEFVPEEHEFGWKTRPRDPTSPAPDDAVRIFVPTTPHPGSPYEIGAPIWWPTPQESWDMAFVLTSPIKSLYWDELGDDEWSDFYPPPPIPPLSHWVDSAGNPVTVYPDNSYTNATVRTDTVTVVADRSTRDLRVPSGVLAVSGTATVSPAGKFQMGSAGEYAVELDGSDNSLVAAAGKADLSGTLSLQATVARSVGLFSWATETRAIITAAGPAGVVGTFDTEPSMNQHLGLGVFYQGITYGPNSVTLDVLQALGGDLDGDRDVDFADFAVLANNYTGTLPPGTGGMDWTQGDIDGDEDVDFTDFNILANNYTPGGYKGGGERGGLDKSAVAMLGVGTDVTRIQRATAHDAVFARTAGRRSARSAVSPSKSDWLYELEPMSIKERSPRKNNSDKEAVDEVLTTYWR